MSWCLVKATCFEPLVLHHISEISIWFTRKWEVLLQYLSTPTPVPGRQLLSSRRDVAVSCSCDDCHAPLFSLKNRNEKWGWVKNKPKKGSGRVVGEISQMLDSVRLGFPYSNVDSKIETYWNVWHLSREDTCTEQSHRKDKYKQL
jgi:hypothetical protein